MINLNDLNAEVTLKLGKSVWNVHYALLIKKKVISSNPVKLLYKLKLITKMLLKCNELQIAS